MRQTDRIEAITEAEIKEFMRLLVEQAKHYPIVYKYLTYESGCQMLRYNNIQFTRGDKLNDVEDLSIAKIDTRSPRELCKTIGVSMDIVDKKIKELSAILSSFGICSLGISPFNNILWERYSRNKEGLEDGICIGLNQKKVIKYLISQNIKAACVLVRYEENATSSIPWFTQEATSPIKIFIGYRFFSLKNSYPWKSEQEIRLIYPQTMEKGYERFVLPKDCFVSVHYGKDMTLVQKKKVSQIIIRNLPIIKIIPRVLNSPSIES